jgi:hypothetical protein
MKFNQNLLKTIHYYTNKAAKYSKQILVGTIALALTVIMFMGLSNYNSNVRMIAAGYGQLQINVSKVEMERMQSKVAKIMSGEIKAEAGIPGVGGPTYVINFIEQVLSQKAITEIVLNFLINQVIGQLFSAINSFFDGLLNTLDKIVDTVERLATAISGTRIAVGFKLFEDISGKEGEGNTNFIGAGDFAIKLLSGRTGSSIGDKTLSGAEKSKIFLEDKENKEVYLLIKDTISWLDFMNIQRYAQYDLVGDALATDGGLAQIFSAAATSISPELGKVGQSFLLDNISEAMYQIDDIVSGKRCEQPNGIINKIPIISSLVGYKPCNLSVRGTAYSELTQRQSNVFGAVTAKINKLAYKDPANCKDRNFFDVEDGFGVDYNVSTPGNLGNNIAQAATKITLKSLSSEECDTITSLRKDQGLNAQDLSVGVTQDIGQAINQVVSNFSKQIDKFFTGFLANLTAKFNRVLAIINNINLGNGFLLYTTLFKIAYSIRNDVRDKLIEKSDKLNVPISELYKTNGLNDLYFDPGTNEPSEDLVT